MKYLLSSLLALIILACNSQDDFIENTYWVRIKNDKTKGLVKFENGGKYVYYEKLNKKYSYQVNSKQFVFKDDSGIVKKYRIIKMNPKLIMLEDYEAVDQNDTIIFRRASNKDFIIGSWLSSAGESKLNIDEKRIIELKLDKDTFNILRSSFYDVRDNQIVVAGRSLRLKFDDDYKKLGIYESNNRIFNLKRESYY